jgi:hypothetical protein
MSEQLDDDDHVGQCGGLDADQWADSSAQGAWMMPVGGWQDAQQMVWMPPAGAGGFMPFAAMPVDSSDHFNTAMGAPMRPQKQRFCATFPHVSRCRHGRRCAFAHSREEVCAPLLSIEEEMREPSAFTDEFFTERFKTLWCPIGTQHDWQLCMYAHTYQDVRRPPCIGYGHQLCPYWSKKETTLAYSQRCPLGPRCAYAHGAKEQLYHPGYFRTLVCRDLQRRRCPRQTLCAFYHKKNECRQAYGTDVDYSKPLKKDALPQDWLAYFLSPPHFQDVPTGLEEGGTDGSDMYSNGMGGAATMAPFGGCRGGTALMPGAMPMAAMLPSGMMQEDGDDCGAVASKVSLDQPEARGQPSKGNRRSAKGSAAKAGTTQPMWGSTNGYMDESAMQQWGSSDVPYVMGGQFYPYPGMYQEPHSDTP